jgi:3-oxoacyl-[acyl-carrier protein] reductase
MNLNNKTVIITGASHGIGAAITEVFAQEKANVVLAYRNNEKGAKELEAKIKKSGGTIMLFQGDLSNEEMVKKLFSNVVNKFNTVDILINNAGKPKPKSIMEATKKDWLESFDNNFFTAVLCTQQAIKLMEKNKLSKIINTSSINGLEHVGRAGNIAYSAAKAALINFTKTLAKEYAPKILINAVAPGLTYTDYWKAADPEFQKRSLLNVPIKRFITVEEMADVYLFLAKNDSLTGEVIVADGGFNLRDYK